MGRVVKSEALIAVEQRILSVRGQHVMVDYDLAELYGVETGALNRAVNVTRTAFRRISCFSSRRKKRAT